MVIGGGPAGIMAAGRAAELGAKVTLVEKSYRLGAKLLITGGGRCNLTNSADLKAFVNAFGRNGKFLYRALSEFSNNDLVSFFSRRGLKIRNDPDGKIFPASDSAESVLKLLREYLVENKVQILHNSTLSEVLVSAGAVKQVFGVKLADGNIINTAKAIIATGGLSYPKTGSTGDGYRIAKATGHIIVMPRPGLTALESDAEWINLVQGLTLKDIEIKVLVDGKPDASAKGDLLFTHFGVSGPAVLNLSGVAVDALIARKKVEISCNSEPGTNPHDFEKTLQKEFEASGNRTLSHYLNDVLPKSLAPVFLKLSNVHADKRCSFINREERRIVAKLFTDFRISITGPRPIEEATITKGGICLEDIDPATMESKIVRGLYFCGEVLDLDGQTGGYNLQEAFSTGFLAGQSAVL